MLVLFENSLGLSLFKFSDGKLKDPNLFKEFENPDSASNLFVTVYMYTYFVLTDIVGSN